MAVRRRRPALVVGVAALVSVVVGGPDAGFSITVDGRLVAELELVDLGNGWLVTGVKVCG